MKKLVLGADQSRSVVWKFGRARSTPVRGSEKSGTAIWKFERARKKTGDAIWNPGRFFATPATLLRQGIARPRFHRRPPREGRAVSRQ